MTEQAGSPSPSERATALCASEKLKALDRRFAMDTWPVGDLIPNEEYGGYNELFTGTEAALVALRNALLQIVAVVEAAEAIRDGFPFLSHPGEYGGDWVPFVDSLAALDEALS